MKTAYDPFLSKYDKERGKNKRIVLHCLSMTYKRWIASDGMSSYIVEIKN